MTSGTDWESRVGYSRAVRVGRFVWVSGTTASDPVRPDGTPVDVYTQTRQALARIGDALDEAGARLEDVVRTRIFVTDIADWEEVGRAHREVLGKAAPAASMVEVRRLIAPELRVEIEVDAYVARDLEATASGTNAGPRES